MPLPPLVNKASTGARALRLLRAAPALLWLALTLLLGNLIQLISLSLLPLSRSLFRRVNREIADLWWGLCVAVGRSWHGVQVVYSGDDPPPRENVVLVANHQDMADITFLMFLAHRKKRLGDMKWFVKRQLKWVPGVGWGMQFLDCLFVARDWARDATLVERTFSRIIRGKVPLWLISFSEGTRITPKKLNAAQAFARERGLPVPKHVLIPRTRGFVASVQGLRGHVDAVYDVTIGYVGGVPTLLQYMLGLVRIAHIHVRRFPLVELPSTDDELAAWLSGRFVEKDRLLDGFYRNGTFTNPA